MKLQDLLQSSEAHHSLKRSCCPLHFILQSHSKLRSLSSVEKETCSDTAGYSTVRDLKSRRKVWKETLQDSLSLISSLSLEVIVDHSCRFLHQRDFTACLSTAERRAGRSAAQPTPGSWEEIKGERTQMWPKETRSFSPHTT